MPNDLYIHIVAFAVFLSMGSCCLFISYLYFFKNSEGKSIRSSVPILCSVFAGISILASGFHYELSVHKSTISHLATSGKSDSSSLMLALLGVVMTLVTAGVITISRQAIEDIRREKQGLKNNYKEIKRIESLQNINLIRLELLYQNQQELDAYTLNSEITEKEKTQLLFRESLQAHYTKRDTISNYINDLHKRYSSTYHGKLLTLEYDYLDSIKRHYETFPPEKEERQNIPELIDDIIKR